MTVPARELGGEFLAPNGADSHDLLNLLFGYPTLTLQQSPAASVVHGRADPWPGRPFAVARAAGMRTVSQGHASQSAHTQSRSRAHSTAPGAVLLESCLSGATFGLLQVVGDLVAGPEVHLIRCLSAKRRMGDVLVVLLNVVGHQ